ANPGATKQADAKAAATKPGDAKEGDAAPGAGAPAGAWKYRVGELVLDASEVALHDASVKPAAALGLQDIQVAVSEISQDLSAKWPVKAGFKVRGGGSFDAEGSVVAGAPSADLKLRLAGLALAIAQPYLDQFARLRIVGGTASTAGRLRFG